VGRTIVGPPAGFLADALGWTPFFAISVVASVPGLALLHRFAPLGGREPDLEAEARIESNPLTRARLAVAGSIAGLIGLTIAASITALMAALRSARGDAPFDLVAAFGAMLRWPVDSGDFIRAGTLAVVALFSGGATAAFLAARHGVRTR
jgi:hypothetical protein